MSLLVILSTYAMEDGQTATSVLHHHSIPGSSSQVPKATSPKQTSPKTSVAAQPSLKTPTATTPQQSSPKAKTPVKPVQTKMDTKKVPPTKGEQQSSKVVMPNKGKGPSKSKEKEPLTMEQKIADVDKKITARAKEASKADSPTMANPFDKVPKPSKTVDRIVESPDGDRFQLPPEEEKKKIDTTKMMEQLGLLPFSDNENDDASLETFDSHNSKGSNKS